jgi:polyhydroxyalkanoate synthase subunit PhaC
MIAASHTALQHAAPAQAAPPRAPRPLPLFLDMVQRVAQTDPALAARALAGVRAYASADRLPARIADRVTDHAGVKLHWRGAAGPVVLLVPSLINPHTVLDLDDDRSLHAWLAGQGYRAALLEWNAPSPADAALDLAGHVEQRLIPVLADIGEPVHLVGYCLGGLLATAAAQLTAVRSLTLLASPWHFIDYGEDARATLSKLWQVNAGQVNALGLMPMELLQVAFWSLDPARTVAKYAALADCDPNDARLRQFARLEDWANQGAPLTAGAASDLFDGLLRDDISGQGQWRVGGVTIDPSHLRLPMLHFTAADDRIAPAATAARAIATHACPSGHVGMIVGRGAQLGCWQPLAKWLASL